MDGEEDKLFGKTFQSNRKLGFHSTIELINKNNGMSIDRILAKLQIELGYSEDKAEKMIKILRIDKRIEIKDGMVFISEAKN